MDLLASFRTPSVLFLLVIPAMVIAWVWTRRGSAVSLPLDHSAPVPRKWTTFFLRSAETVPALVLALVIVILAGPQSWDEPRSKRVLTNIQVCVDVSGSMMSTFGEGTRYDAAMRSTESFLDLRKGDAFGLTFFGNATLHWVPLTTDTSAFRCAAPFMKPGSLPYWFNGTSIGAALLSCRKELIEREEGDRMIILVTDGYSADLGGGRDEEIARQLKKDGIVVYTVHIAEGQIPDEVVRIAGLTGGEAFKPEDEDGLKRVYARIDSMQKARMEKTQAEAADHFGPWALGALSLLGLGLMALFGLRTTPW
ncbi:MAG: VWA domain-containing protein [Planctomycetota bacterium]|nr:VWA domain-containing protein [Planctomycetota bacterium]